MGSERIPPVNEILIHIEGLELKKIDDADPASWNWRSHPCFPGLTRTRSLVRTKASTFFYIYHDIQFTCS
jgi:hypothetical protein